MGLVKNSGEVAGRTTNLSPTEKQQLGRKWAGLGVRQLRGAAHRVASFHVQQRGILLTCTEEHTFSHVLNNIHVTDYLSFPPCVSHVFKKCPPPLPAEGGTAVHEGWRLSCLPGPMREGAWQRGASAVLLKVGATFHAS